MQNNIVTLMQIENRMNTTAITFRAEPDFIVALRDYAAKCGLSVNRALREILAPAIGFTKPRTASVPRNNLARFSGCLDKESCQELRRAQAAFSIIDKDLWK